MSIHPLPFPIAPPAGVLLHLHVTEPEVVHELERHAAGAARDEFARQALRVGVLALRQASGALDADSIRREGAQIVGSVRELLLERSTQLTEGIARSLALYLDPSSGSLPQRLEQLTKNGGEIERVLARHLDGDRSSLAQTMAKHVGEQSPLLKVLSPKQSDGLLAVLAKSVQHALDAQRDEMLKQFSLDNADGALSRLVGRVETAQKTIVEQLSLDHDGSALQRLATLLEKTADSNVQFHAEVKTTLEAMRVRREEAARSTTHGATFEDALGEMLADDARKLGDLFEAVGTKNGRQARKVGDHVLTLGPECSGAGARIVIEAKANKSYSEADALVELGLARKNREAQIGVMIFERASAPEALATFRRVGPDILAVWDPMDPITDVYVRAAVTVARALAVRDRSEEARSRADVRELEAAIHDIAEQARALDDIVKAAHTIEKKGHAVLETAQLVRDALARQVTALRRHVGSARAQLGASS